MRRMAWMMMVFTGIAVADPAPKVLEVKALTPHARQIVLRMTHQDEYMRRSAVMNLIELNDLSVQPWIRNALTQDASPTVREACLQFYVRQKQAGVEGLQVALTDADDGVRTEAVKGLAELTGMAATSLVDAMIADGSPKVREAALTGLSKMSVKADHLWHRWTAATKDPAPKVRAAAMQWMRWQPVTPETLAYLEEGLKDPDPLVKLQAVGAFIESKPETAMRVLKEVAKAPEGQTRLWALSTLSNMKGAGWADYWATHLADPYEGVRTFAVKKLAQKDLQGDALLLQHFQRASTDAKVKILTALWDLWTPATLGVLKAGAEDPFAVVRRPAVDGLGRYPVGTPGVKEKVLEKIVDPELQVRTTAVGLALTHVTAQDREKLLAMMKDVSADVMAEFVKIVLTIPGTGEHVIPYLSGPDPRIREAVLNGVLSMMPVWDKTTRKPKLGEQGVVLRWIAKEGEPRWRVFATEILARHQDTKTRKEWEEALATKEEAVRIQVAKGLAEVTDPEVLPVQMTLLEDHQYAPHWLPLLRTLFRMGPLAKPALPTLLKFAEKKHPDMLMQEIVRTLGALKDPGALPMLARCAQRKEFVFKSLSAAAVGSIGVSEGAPILLSMAEEPDPRVRQVAVERLMMISLAEAGIHPTVTKLTQDPDAHVRQALAQTVGEWKQARYLPVVLTLMADPDRSVRGFAIGAVRKMGPAARDAGPSLVARLKDEDSQNRMMALYALADLKDERFQPVIVELSTGPDPLLKAVAMHMLNPTMKVEFPPMTFGDPKGGAEKQELSDAERFLRHVQHASDTDRHNAVLGLLRATLRDERWTHVLRLAMGDPSEQVSAKVPATLAAWTEAERPVLESAAGDPNRWVRLTSTRLLAVLSRAARAPLGLTCAERLADDEDSRVREAARMLWAAQGAVGLTGAVAAFPKASPRAKEVYVEALGGVRHPLAHTLMSWGLDDKTPSVKITTVRTATAMTGSVGERWLIQALWDPAANVWEPAVRELARRKSPAALKPLQDLLKSKAAFHRRIAVEAMAAYGPAQAKAWIPLVRDEDPYVQAAVRNEARKIGGATAKAVNTALSEGAKDKDPKVRVKAYQVAPELPKDKALALYALALKDRGEVVQQSGSSTITLMVSGLADVKKIAIIALKEMKEARAKTMLMEVVKDRAEHPYVRALAAEAWVTKGDRSQAGTAAFHSAIMDITLAVNEQWKRTAAKIKYESPIIPEPVIWCLKALQQWKDPRAVASVVDFSHDPLPAVRKEAVAALLAMNDPRADQAIAERLTDENVGVQEAARKAQAEIAKRPPPPAKK